MNFQLCYLILKIKNIQSNIIYSNYYYIMLWSIIASVRCNRAFSRNININCFAHDQSQLYRYLINLNFSRLHVLFRIMNERFILFPTLIRIMNYPEYRAKFLSTYLRQNLSRGLCYNDHEFLKIKEQSYIITLEACHSTSNPSI